MEQWATFGRYQFTCWYLLMQGIKARGQEGAIRGSHISVFFFRDFFKKMRDPSAVLNSSHQKYPKHLKREFNHGHCISHGPMYYYFLTTVCTDGRNFSFWFHLLILFCLNPQPSRIMSYL